MMQIDKQGGLAALEAALGAGGGMPPPGAPPPDTGGTIQCGVCASEIDAVTGEPLIDPTSGAAAGALS